MANVTASLASPPPWLLVRVAVAPERAFRELAETQPDANVVFFRHVFWLALPPPAFAFVGGSLFGWRLGADEPLKLAADAQALVSVGYFATLLVGLLTTAAVTRWMAVTYGARQSFGLHLALVGAVAVPLVVGSVCHLYPHAFVNLLVLIPALIWSMYLLYTGLPIVLNIDPQRGMLMASAVIAWLLVAMVSLLGLTVALWSGGIGPSIGV